MTRQTFHDGYQFRCWCVAPVEEALMRLPRYGQVVLAARAPLAPLPMLTALLPGCPGHLPRLCVWTRPLSIGLLQTHCPLRRLLACAWLSPAACRSRAQCEVPLLMRAAVAVTPWQHQASPCNAPAIAIYRRNTAERAHSPEGFRALTYRAAPLSCAPTRPPRTVHACLRTAVLLLHCVGTHVLHALRSP